MFDGNGGGNVSGRLLGGWIVLMAGGTTKAIDQIKVGDTIANAVPGQSGTQAHTVTAVIVTTTDHDFVDVTVQSAGKSAKADKPTAATLKQRVVRKAAVGLAASAAILATFAAVHPSSADHDLTASPVAATSPVTTQGDHLTTTFHHPFYDETQAAFTEAKDLHDGDILQTPTGIAQVTGVRLFHANTTTYDLTIGTLHTYYVLAGAAPVLVHNCNGGTAPNGVSCSCNGSTNPSTPDLISEIAARAEAKVGGSGAVKGTLKHSYAEKLLDRYQGIYGDRGILQEQSYLNGVKVPKGTSGSARPDVFDEPNGIIYDYKFLLNPGRGIGKSQADKNALHVPGANITIEVNP